MLCDLEGRTRKEAARQLSLPEGTVSGRLTTARRQLAERLSRRGVSLSAGALSVLISRQAAGSVPPDRAARVVETALSLAAGGAAGPAVPAAVVAITEGVLKAMLLNKLKTATVPVLLAALLVGGLAAGVRARQAQAGEPPRDTPPAKAGPTAADAKRPDGAGPAGAEPQSKQLTPRTPDDNFTVKVERVKGTDILQVRVTVKLKDSKDLPVTKHELRLFDGKEYIALCPVHPTGADGERQFVFQVAAK